MTGTLIAGAIVALTGSIASANFQYIYDDGGAELTLGRIGGSINWGNSFDVDPSNALIQSIEFGFGIDSTSQPLAGTPVEWAIFGDTDNDPTNGMTLLATDEHIIVNDGFAINGVVDTIAVNVDVSGFSTFFVSANGVDRVGAPGDNNGQLHATIDLNSTSAQRSWIMRSPINFSDYSAGLLIDDLNSSFAGNWIIRANAVPAPGAAVLAGVAGLVAVRRRR